jgi:hypothetical protein
MIVLDAALPDSIRTLIKAELKSAGKTTYKTFPTMYLQKEMQYLQANGYGKQLNQPYPWIFREETMLRLVDQMFKNFNNTQYDQSVSYSRINNNIKRHQDILICAEKYIAAMRPVVMYSVWDIKQDAVPTVLVTEAPIGDSATWSSIGRTVATGVVLATTMDTPVMKEDNTQTLRYVEGSDGDAFAQDVLDSAYALFEHLKRLNAKK